MKYIFCLITCLFVLIRPSAAQTKYFDIDDKEITKEQADLRRKEKYISMSRTATSPYTEYRLSRYRDTLSAEETGQLYTYFSTITGRELDRNIPLVIRYHQASDPCNLSGDHDPDRVKRWHAELGKQLDRKGKTELLIVYKTADRISVLYPDLPAYFDKYNVLGKFFKYQYGCGSVFLLNPNNTYACVNGEYSIEWVVKIHKELKRSRD